MNIAYNRLYFTFPNCSTRKANGRDRMHIENIKPIKCNTFSEFSSVFLEIKSQMDLSLGRKRRPFSHGRFSCKLSPNFACFISNTNDLHSLKPHKVTASCDPEGFIGTGLGDVVLWKVLSLPPSSPNKRPL